MRHHSLEAPYQSEEEQEFNRLVDLSGISCELFKYSTDGWQAHPRCIRRSTGTLIARVIQMEDLLEQNDPANPRTGSVEDRLDRVLHAVVHLQLVLDRLADMTPRNHNHVADEGWYNVDDEREEPRD